MQSLRATRNISPQHSCSIPRSARFHVDLLFGLLRFPSLRQRHRYHAFLEAGVNLIEINAVGHRKRTLKRTKTALAEIAGVVIRTSDQSLNQIASAIPIATPIATVKARCGNGLLGDRGARCPLWVKSGHGIAAQ
jgi:hypothetical protein